MESPVVGVLGGGQLGRMLTEAAHRLNIKVVTLDSENAPAKQINARSDHVIGSFADPEAVRQLAKECDLITIEIEHVDTDVLEDISEGKDTQPDWRLVASTKTPVQPSWRTIRVIQDKYNQKEHLMKHEIPTAPSIAVDNNSTADLEDVGRKLDYPYMLKSRTDAYDGRGNYPVMSVSDSGAALAALKGRPLYAEKWANFKMELAVMVVKTTNEAITNDWRTGTMAFPVVETIHEDSICKLVYAPARHVSNSVAQEAQALARRAVASFWGKGVFGVELFLLPKEQLVVNEIAPRPHNSGHYTIEACHMSQYEAHLRAILGRPIPPKSLEFLTPNLNAVMLNILGGVHSNTHLTVEEKALSVEGARIHDYGKGVARPGRKMGHITLVAEAMATAEARIAPLIELVDKIRSERMNPAPGPAAQSLQPTSDGSSNRKVPLVAVTMGSDSDSSVLAPGIALLRELEIPHIVTITSAHRTPDRMFSFAKSAADKGIKVIIAAAGGAAHLPGMVAASTHLPVFGVPVKASALDGMDSLLSQVQMPKGCPVATFGINNSINAAQHAARVLALADVNLRMRLIKYLADQTNAVVEKAEQMEQVGFEEYFSHK